MRTTKKVELFCSFSGGNMHDIKTIDLAKGARVIDAIEESGTFYLIVDIDTDRPVEPYSFIITSLGREIPADCFDFNHVATIRQDRGITRQHLVYQQEPMCTMDPGCSQPYDARVMQALVDAKLTNWLTNLITHMEEEHETWSPVAIVEIEATEDREPGYKEYPHCRIKGDESKRLYCLNEDEEPFGHYYVWQTNGVCGDDYSGWLLFPLPDGRYLQVRYAC